MALFNKTIWLFCFCIGNMFLAQADTPPDSISYFKDRLSQNTPIDSIAIYKAKALAYFISKNDLSEWLKSHSRLARHTWNEPAKHSTTISIYQEGLAFFRPPESAADWKAVRSYYINIGYFHQRIAGRFADAKKYYELAKRTQENQLKTEHDVYTTEYILHPLGNIYTRFGDYDKAIALLIKSTHILSKNKNWSALAETYADLHVAYSSKGEYNNAITALKKGLSVAAIPPISRSGLELLLTESLLEQQQLTEAEHQLTKASQTISSIKDSAYQTRQRCDVQRLRAEIFYAREDWTNAEKYFLHYLKNYIAYFGTSNRREIAKVHHRIGVFYLKQQKIEKALQQFHQGQIALFEHHSNTPAIKLPGKAALYPENTISEILHGKALAFERRYQKSNDLNDLKLAVSCHELIWNNWQLLRSSYEYESSSLALQSITKQMAEKAIDLSMRIYEQTGHQKYFEKAYNFNERSKSLLLLESFQKNNPAIKTDIPDSLLVKERRIAKEIRNHERNQYLKATTDAQALRDTIFQLKSQAAQLKEEIKACCPTYAQLAYNAPIPTIEDIQQLLKKNDASLINYFIGEEACYLFHFSKSNFNLIKIPLDFPIRIQVKEFLKSLYEYQLLDKKDAIAKKERDQLYLSHATGLYQKLIEPIESKLSATLIIIPDGILGYIPFETLLPSSPTRADDYKNHPYLGLSHQVSYNYSTALWVEMDKKQYTWKGFTGVAPSFQPSSSYEYAATKSIRSHLNHLFYNVDEITAINQYFNGQLLIGAEATKDQVEQLAQNSSILHLATHAKSNESNSRFSYIAFNQADIKTGKGLLYLNDLYLKPFPLDMVVLSACETGIGELKNGEGIFSMSRGFAAAGTKSIFTTLWGVNDHSSKELMVRFYKYLNKGFPKDKALQMAKIDYLSSIENEEHAHPYYWSAFIGIGDMEAIQQTNRNYLYFFLMIGLSLFLLFYLRKRTKKQQLLNGPLYPD